MEYLGIFGMFGFVIAAHLHIEVTKLKKQTAEFELKLTQLQSQKDA